MKKIISFSLWGDSPFYIDGAYKNIELAKEIYPDWICRFYVASKNTPEEVTEKLRSFENVEVILMDEPTSALDPIATATIEELMSELKSAYTIVIVTHSMQQAARISDRTAYFHLGRLVEVDETGHIFTNPNHSLTENYITGRFG